MKATWTTKEIATAKRHLANVQAVGRAISKHEREGGERTPEARRRVAAKALRDAFRSHGRSG